MARFLSLEELLERRHFDSEITVRAAVSAFKAQLPGPGGDDGGVLPLDCRYHDHALGAPFCAGAWGRECQDLLTTCDESSAVIAY
jgi:hypothetical protein